MSDELPSLDAARAVDWLSSPRYRRYLNVAGGSHALAMETYLWNSRVAAAGIVDVGHLEVAVRNAYDRALTRRYPDWTIDPRSPLLSLEQGVESARARQRRRNQMSRSRVTAAKRGLSSSPTHPEVVAALTFGFWSSLTVSERSPTLWNPMLRRDLVLPDPGIDDRYRTPLTCILPGDRAIPAPAQAAKRDVSRGCG